MPAPRLALSLLAIAAGAAMGTNAVQAQQAGTPNCPSCATWNAPQAPFRLFGNSYYVGTHGLSAILVTSPTGHVLIDGALPESAPLIAANIRALGFRLEDVKVILNSHVHFDHAGGIAELQRQSGATVYGSARSVRVLRSGDVGRDDPQFGIITPIAPVKRVREIPAGDSVRAGTLVLRALHTAGHTAGGTSWTWTSCEGSDCRTMVYGDSQSAISADGFFYTNSATYPTALADFAAGFAALESASCDILVTPHPEAVGLWERLAKREGGDRDALRDTGACKAYAAGARARLANRVAQEHEQRGRRIAELRDCALVAGGTLPGCRLSYRIFGALNADRSNAVLLPTWFLGSSQDWQGVLGADGYVDTTRYAAIAVDAFGAGHSSSPSDSAWKGRAFPAVAIADMVTAQHRLLREQLGVTRLHAVVGFSMGGMQAFEWGVRYSQDVGRVVAIEGSPRLTAYDRVLWEAMQAPLTASRRGAIPRDSALVQAARLLSLVGTTPVALNAQPADSVPGMIRGVAQWLGSRPTEDILLQLQAMLGHDVARGVGGSADAAHRAFTAPLLVVSSADDHVVTAQGAMEFARAVRADTLVVPSACGHQLFACERARVAATVRAFLAR